MERDNITKAIKRFDEVFNAPKSDNICETNLGCLILQLCLSDSIGIFSKIFNKT